MDRAISVPYDKSFYRTNAHYSNLYFGASLKALTQLAAEKGYAFVGCNLGGSNAFNVKKEFIKGDRLPSVSISEGFRPDKCRQGRNPDNTLSYLRGEERLAAHQEAQSDQRKYRRGRGFIRQLVYLFNTGIIALRSVQST